MLAGQVLVPGHVGDEGHWPGWGQAGLGWDVRAGAPGGVEGAGGFGHLGEVGAGGVPVGARLVTHRPHDYTWSKVEDRRSERWIGGGGRGR